MLRIVSLITVLTLPPSSQDQASQDLEKLQGIWSVEKAEHGGKPLPATDPLYSRKFVIENDRLYVQGEKGRAETDGTFTLDAAKQPKQIDATTAGKVIKGIYEIDGDKLKWHLGGPHGTEARPKEFVTKDDGSFSMMVILRREKH